MALACDVSTARYWRGVPRTDDRKTLLACSSETVKLHTLVSTVRWLKEGTVWSVVHEIASPSWQETRSFVRVEWDRRFLNSFSVLRLLPKRCLCFLLLQQTTRCYYRYRVQLARSRHAYVAWQLLAPCGIGKQVFVATSNDREWRHLFFPEASFYPIGEETTKLEKYPTLSYEGLCYEVDSRDRFCRACAKLVTASLFSSDLISVRSPHPILCCK